MAKRNKKSIRLVAGFKSMSADIVCKRLSEKTNCEWSFEFKPEYGATIFTSEPVYVGEVKMMVINSWFDGYRFGQYY